MPFTPLHMGPGIFFKSLLQGSFSLMIFGWTQIIMDIQPLLVMITGKGQLHGITHTYIMAIPIALIAVLTGKHLAQFGLWLLRVGTAKTRQISWLVAFISALIGSVSHVFFDSIMHTDVEPFYPFSTANPFWQWMSIDTLHILMLLLGLLGTVIYFFVQWRIKGRLDFRNL